jgi:hypothetical protein
MKIYFNNLNGIRFLLAFMVIILHTAAIKQHNGLPNYLSDAPYLYVAGEIAVSLFFTLSGFLITYYLLIEKQKTNTIQLKLFYFKRILRIWPLYFLAIILYWLIVPNLSMGTMLNDLPAQMTGRFVIFDENISWGNRIHQLSIFHSSDCCNLFRLIELNTLSGSASMEHWRGRIILHDHSTCIMESKKNRKNTVNTNCWLLFFTGCIFYCCSKSLTIKYSCLY